jgi:hypothetical protein
MVARPAMSQQREAPPVEPQPRWGIEVDETERALAPAAELVHLSRMAYGRDYVSPLRALRHGGAGQLAQDPMPLRDAQLVPHLYRIGGECAGVGMKDEGEGGVTVRSSSTEGVWCRRRTSSRRRSLREMWLKPLACTR